MAGTDQVRLLPGNPQSPPTEQEAEAVLRREGYEPFRWHDVPGSSYPLHRHAADECLWVLQGELIITIGNSTYELKAGDRLYLPSKIPHTARAKGSGGVTYLVGQK